jgi:hypothetical protein
MQRAPERFDVIVHSRGEVADRSAISRVSHPETETEQNGDSSYINRVLRQHLEAVKARPEAKAKR